MFRVAMCSHVILCAMSSAAFVQRPSLHYIIRHHKRQSVKLSRSCLRDHCKPVQKELEIEHIKSLARPRFVKSTVGMTYVSQLHWSDFCSMMIIDDPQCRALSLKMSV